MINPFSHIQDILNRSSKEAARTLGREISVEHLMLSLISQNDSDVNKLLKGADISPMAFSGVHPHPIQPDNRQHYQRLYPRGKQLRALQDCRAKTSAACHLEK